MEIIWLAFHKRKGRKFPVREELRVWFSKPGSAWPFSLKRYGYWGWVIASFVIAVGRWMFFTNLLRLTGASFCPNSLSGVTATSILFTYMSILANVLLKVQGLTL